MSKENEKAIPTQEEYIAEQIATKRAIALNKSRNRTSVKVPMVTNDLSKEEWLRFKNREIAENEQKLSAAKAEGDEISSRLYENELNKALEELEKGYPTLIPGANCMYNAGDCYGLNIPGNRTFAAKHKNLGFKKISSKQMEPGDIVQDNRVGTPSHAMIYDSKDNEGKPLFNYARGTSIGDINIDYVKQGKYPLPLDDYATYRYVGTPADSTQWINQYNQIYGLGKGGIIGIPYLKKGSGIHIKKKNRGKFTEYCGGEVTDKCIQKAKNSKNPTLRKRATFAQNSRSWSKKHFLGGVINIIGID